MHLAAGGGLRPLAERGWACKVIIKLDIGVVVANFVVGAVFVAVFFVVASVLADTVDVPVGVV